MHLRLGQPDPGVGDAQRAVTGFDRHDPVVLLSAAVIASTAHR
jgi:hypothetical protein